MHVRGQRAALEGRKVVAQPPAGQTALADLDTQLMLQARAGDREAAGGLIRRNSPRIARYIARLVGSAEPVEDLTQDVFVQALSHADDYQPTAKVATWLYRIATNVCLNHFKRSARSRRAADPTGGQLEVPDRSTPSPDRQMTLDELRSQIAAALHELPLNQRVALTLFQYEDCTYEQIATVLGVSVEAVRSLLMRARTTLRARLHGLI